MKQNPSQNVYLQRAIDRQREIRHCFRELTGCNGNNLENAIIQYSSPRTDLPLIYELSKQYDIPCTFERGIPIAYSKPARSLLLYLDWVAADFDVHYLWRLMYDGVPYFKQFFEAGITLGRLEAAPLLQTLAPLLRDLDSQSEEADSRPGETNTGPGRERYLPALAGLLADIPDENRQRKGKVRILTAYILALLEVTPSKTAAGPSFLSTLATASAALLTRHCKASTALERESREILLDYLSQTVNSKEVMSLPQALERLRADVLSLPHGASGPKPGRLHCAPLTGQSHSATGQAYPLREHRYVIGHDVEPTVEETKGQKGKAAKKRLPEDTERLPLLMTALRALANPHDESAARAFLHGPVCGVAEKALDNFRSKGGKLLFFLTIPSFADDGIRSGLQLLKQGARWTRSNHPAATVALIAGLLGLWPDTLTETDTGTDDIELRNAMALAAIISTDGGSFFDIVSGLDLSISTGSEFSS